jgi:hypothetical protein
MRSFGNPSRAASPRRHDERKQHPKSKKYAVSQIGKLPMRKSSGYIACVGGQLFVVRRCLSPLGKKYVDNEQPCSVIQIAASATLKVG